MKKILIISLFGLFVAHESSAMFARAAKTASRLAVGLFAASGIFVCADYADQTIEMNRLSCLTDQEREIELTERRIGLTPENARLCIEEYDQWAAQNNDQHKKEADRWRAIDEPKFLYNLEFFKRFCTDEEKNCCKEVLMKYGYSEDKALKISEKIFIIKNIDSDNGKYMVKIYSFLESIGLSESVMSGILQGSLHEERILLHECEHYNYIVGHYDSLKKFFPRMEEMRAEIESMRKMGKKLPELSKEQEKISLWVDIMQLPDSKRKNALIDIYMRGYVANSQNVRNLIVREAFEKEYAEKEEVLDRSERA